MLMIFTISLYTLHHITAKEAESNKIKDIKEKATDWASKEHWDGCEACETLEKIMQSRWKDITN